MRLFIACNFPHHVRQFLVEQQNLIKTVCTKGRFTKEENLHLTLIFLGEVAEEDLPSITTILDRVKTAPFSITFNELGSFKRRDGDIWWMGISPNPPLQSLHKNLFEELVQAGFNLDARPFTPHITLARGVRLHQQVEGITETLTARVHRISLMQTVHVLGRLSYIELHGKNLSSPK